MSRTRKKIMIVKTGEPVPSVAATRGQFADLIKEVIGDAFEGDYESFDAREGEHPDPRAADAFIITGSAANVPTREAWIVRTEAWLREVVAAGTPTFGICFGHQLLAQALGGEVQRNPRGREIGSIAITRRDGAGDPVLAGLPSAFVANVTHVDTVVSLPEGAVSLSKSALEDHHAIRFGDACYGVQFHPEIDADVMRGYILSRREILASEGFDVDAMLADVSDAHDGRVPLKNFVRAFVSDTSARRP